MSVVSDIFAGGASGILEGVGSLALKLREAITGKTVLSSDDQIKLLEIATEMDRLRINTESALAQAQIDVNKAEASSGSFFASGWRPFTGWGAAFAVVVYPIIRTLLPWFVQTAASMVGHPIPLAPLPALDTSEATTLLLGLLGIGGMRTLERINNKA